MDVDNRERQASELTLLSTMYPTEFSWRSNPPPDLTSTDFSDPSFALMIDRTTPLLIHVLPALFHSHPSFAALPNACQISQPGVPLR